ncbi:TolC family protein [Halarcobacter anaerophilus]|uniref:Transporter n=1 Tax=Halarcobacter anaerophilus TaxID=877500 RepID=A0A4Q0XXT8_9BACT|nr:TolC family protein [Halarcobacter anaerophilus]QDF28081.1 RND family efflux system, outer membrane channel protein, TolC family [Halarcobacter anaerophilus]RXJ62427.1 transporter [Halarcobacter anaerophilus]
MKKFIILSFLSSLLFANNLTILNKDKKDLREIEKKIIQENYEKLKNEWISSIDLTSNIKRSHTFNKDSDSFNKSVSIGFSQNIFESGGIEFTIQYAKDKLKADSLNWESDNNELFQDIYEILLNIEKLKVQLEQSADKYKNSEIELIIKKVQYEAGDGDITELNDAIMSKNNQYKEIINLKNSIKEQELNLAKYTNLKYNQIKIIDFRNINKKDYLEKNIQLMYENASAELLNTTYKKQKSEYLPSIGLSTEYSYSDSDNMTDDINNYTSSGSIGLNLTIPLYDINKKATLQKAKLDYLKQKISLNDLKNELSKTFDEALTKIDTYKKYNKTIEENIKLYEDLIEVNEASNQAGMSPTYDLEVLKNTKKINEYDLAINDINIQLEYAKLYFKIKED